MRSGLTFGVVTVLAGLATPAAAQPDRDSTEIKDTGTNTTSCAGKTGLEYLTCAKRLKAAAKGGGTPGVSAQDGKLFNETNVAANAKLQAKDFVGAAAVYQQAIDANPKSAVLHRLYAGQAIALRQQAIAAYNVEQPVIPPPGSSNDQIRAANASNAGLQARKSAAALPALRRAQEAAGRAAAAAATSKDRGADESIGTELRQTASLLYQLDHDGVLASPRASADLEAASFRQWLAANPQAAGSLVAQFGIATAATVLAKDKAAGLTLADEVIARAGGDADGAIGYADLVVAAKTPAGDPRRAKALAGLAAADAVVSDSAKKQHIQKLKATLSAS